MPAGREGFFGGMIPPSPQSPLAGACGTGGGIGKGRDVGAFGGRWRPGVPSRT